MTYTLYFVGVFITLSCNVRECNAYTLEEIIYCSLTLTRTACALLRRLDLTVFLYCSYRLPGTSNGFIRPPGSVVPDGLLFYRICIFFFLFRRSFSEIPRPIALKLCHIVEIWLNCIIPLQKLGEGGAPPKKFGGQIHAKFRSILDHFRL